MIGLEQKLKQNGCGQLPGSFRLFPCRIGLIVTLERARVGSADRKDLIHVAAAVAGTDDNPEDRFVLSHREGAYFARPRTSRGADDFVLLICGLSCKIMFNKEV